MSSTSRATVLLAEDHPLFLAGLSQVVQGRPELELVGTVRNGREALEQVRALSPAVLVLDLRLPGMDGHAVVEAVAAEGLETRVLVLSAHLESQLVYDVLAAGASGFLSKLTPEFDVGDAIVAVAGGESVVPPELHSGLLTEMRNRRPDDRPRLTEREQAVLVLLAEGMSAPRISEELHLSPATVRTHLQHLYEKLGVSTQAAAVAAAMRQGLLE